MKKNRIYLGIVGSIASGKETITDYLKDKHGFVAFSLSFVVHQELKERKITKFSRQTLQDIGNDLRRVHGNDILARRAVKYFNNYHKKKIIIDGIRNPAEVKYLQTLTNFTLIGVQAKRRLRFERLVKRGKRWDPKAWKEFLKVDSRDWGEGEDSAGQQVGRCLAYADLILTNNQTKEDLYRKTEEVIKKLHLP